MRKLVAMKHFANGKSRIKPPEQQSKRVQNVYRQNGLREIFKIRIRILLNRVFLNRISSEICLKRARLCASRRQHYTRNQPKTSFSTVFRIFPFSF